MSSCARRLHEVDGHTFSSETAAAADAVDVELSVVGQVVTDHQGHLASGMLRRFQQVSWIIGWS